MKKKLEKLYTQYNKRCFVTPDPLEFLYEFKKKQDIEVVGLLASSLAYGNVKQILVSVRNLLNKMGSPSEFLKEKESTIERHYPQFIHRWHRWNHISSLLKAIKKIYSEYGDLENLFLEKMKKQKDFLKALDDFVVHLTTASTQGAERLIARPAAGSACKRLHLFLRWVIREDEVDLGLWKNIDPKHLIIPLDTHMHRLSREMGFTQRNAGDAKTALEITQEFQKICPEDPVRYDFVLTRFGIHPEIKKKKWEIEMKSVI